MVHPFGTTVATYRRHGVVATFRLWRYYAYRLAVLLSRGRAECPICGWSGNSFHPFLLQPCWVRSGAICPGCGALERHRFLYLFYRSYLQEHRLAGRRCLHFAPEECLASVFREAEIDYLPSEYGGPGVGDMQCIDFADNSLDWVVAHHVLEHVEDDGIALREVHRVLKPGGVCHLAVPVTWRLPHTRSLGVPCVRNHGHWREYGADIMERFAGFACRRLAPSDVVPDAAAERFGLRRDEPLFELTKPLG